jgi:hypothetical protein
MTQANVLAQIGATSGPTFRNRIINGSMVISQRNGTSSVNASVAGGLTYTLDRWAYYSTAASKFTIQQNAGSVTPPVGFSNYLGITSSAATSVGSTDLYSIDQAIEGFNVADLGWGTANAKTVTLSFWVRSSLTGTFGGAINNNNLYSYPFSYTISTANTWEYETITIAGPTSGWTSPSTTNGVGLYVWFGLGVGSTVSGTAGAWSASTLYSATGATSVVGTNGATFYITGVQLEAGSSATGFEYENYTSLFSKCQRYYETGSMVSSKTAAGAGSTYNITFQTQKRAAPTVTSTIVGGSNTTATSPIATSTSNQYGQSNGSAVGDYTYWNFTAAIEL